MADNGPSKLVLLLITDSGMLLADDSSDLLGLDFSAARLCNHPVTKELFVVNMSKVVSAKLVDRDSITSGPSKIVIPGGRLPS